MQMQNTLETLRGAISDLSRNVSDQAKSLTELVVSQRQIKEALITLEQDKAVREVEDRHLDERLNEIEKRIDNIINIGRWLLAAVGLAVVTTIVDFALRGGFSHVG